VTIAVFLVLGAAFARLDSAHQAANYTRTAASILADGPGALGVTMAIFSYPGLKLWADRG
jgi:hypothetical protein